ncbi:MAG: phosphatase PAP2 family protein [Melioribacteraceae bacterium]
MTDILYSIDLAIFYFINHTLSNPLFDKFFPFITDVNHWFVAYIILWFILLLKGGRIGKVAAIVMIFLVATSDQVSSNLLKNFFERIRPNNYINDVNLLIGNTKSFSFPSSHAVNNFAVAVFISKLYPKLKWILFITAFLMAFSRPYVGVHYPFDIFMGAIIGSLIGYGFAIIAKRIDSYFIDKKS